MFRRTGILLVVSGPSGSGKSTLCRRLEDEGEIHHSISCTTRPPRPGETDGRDYHFLSTEAFARRLRAGDFLEYAEVHGNSYGTLKSEVLEHLENGVDVVLDIDVQGAAQVRANRDPGIRRALVDVFILPPGAEELSARLSGRATDSPEVIALRLRNALEEMRHWPEYRHCLVSGSKEQDYLRFKSLIIAERLRTTRLHEA